MTRPIRTPLQLKLLAEANQAYPDETLADYFVLKTGRQRRQPRAWDTLALFIGRELLDITEGITDEAVAREAIESALTTAADELYLVINHFGKGI